MRAQLTEQTCETYRGGGVIPAAIPRLLTNSKYSCAPTKTVAAKATVNTHPPASTTPPTVIPMPSPKTILFFNWLGFCWRSDAISSFIDIVSPLSTSYNTPISAYLFNIQVCYQHTEIKVANKSNMSELLNPLNFTFFTSIIATWSEIF